MTVGFGFLVLSCIVLMVGTTRATRMGGAWAAAAFGLMLVGRLAFAFAGQDWRFTYVVDHTRPGLAWPLRVAGIWAGPQGSLLMFVAMAALVLPIVTGLSRNRWGSNLLAGLVGAYSIVLAVVANPFDRLPAPPAQGIGLQPVLEHQAMTWHPPLLYAGLIAAMTAGALTLGGASPASRHRGWLAAVGFGTIGLVTGSRWAHVELGWGGYWAWDPVENAGLVVWLVAVAALHRPRARWSGPLALVAAVWATTVTRIGVINSVHAFADDPPLRLALIAVATGFSLALAVAIRGAGIWPDPSGAEVTETSGDPGHARLLSQRGLATAGLLVAAVVVAAGTYEPAIEALLGGDAVAIAGTYYSQLLLPVAVAGGLAALYSDRRPIPAGIGGAVGAIIVGPAAGVMAMILGAVGGATASSAVAVKARRGQLAHIGIGILLIGVAGTVGTQRTTVRAAVDEPVSIPAFAGGITVDHRGIELIEGRATSRAVATVEVDGRVLHPEIVSFNARSQSSVEMAEVHRLGSFDGTLQVLMSDGDAGAATYQLYWQPRIGFVWLGAALIGLGSVLPLLLQQLVQRRSSGLPVGTSAAAGDTDRS